MSNFHLPIKEGVGHYLGRFHKQLVGDTKFVSEFASRELAKSIVWCPGRMIDKVEEMMETWRKNDTSQAAKPTPYLPIMLVAMSTDYLPVTPDYSRQIADAIPVTIPNDPKGRVFMMRAAVSEQRLQIAIAAPEPSSAKSIAMQLQLFCSSLGNRRFYSQFKLAGRSESWPATLENPDIAGIAVPGDVKNLTILAVDITVRASIPLLMHPKQGDADADGKGSGTEDDPDGYLTVQEVRGKAHPGVIGSIAEVWLEP